jgi:hypothetical protein
MLENQLSRYGAISRFLPKLAPSAEVFLVSYNTPTWYGDFQHAYRPDKKGTIRVYNTIAAAYAATVSGRGDVILVAPNHAETIAAATTLTNAGVSIVGMGEGNNRPTITFATATAASLVMASANTTFDNLIFIGNIASQVVALDFSAAAGGAVRNCVFKAGSATAAPLVTIKTGTASTDMVVDNNTFNYSTNTSNTPTELVTMNGCDRFQFTNNYVSGNFSTAILNNITTLCNDVLVENNALYNLATVATGGIAFFTGTTGYIGSNTCYTAAAANTNFFTTFISPASALLDTNTIQNTLGGGVGGDVSAPMGSYVVLQKTLTSSSITTAAQDLSLPAVGGDLYVENITVETDSTGLAGGTNFSITKNGGFGIATFLTETVANLGANKSVDCFTASVTKQRTVITSGQKFQYLCTGSNCTGAGQVKITVVLVRCTAGADIRRS